MAANWAVRKQKWSNPRNYETGDGFMKLKQEMQRPRPKKGLAALPASEVFDLFACVRCGDIPDPQAIMTCEEGHYTCQDCAFSASGKELQDGKNVKVQPCCEVRNLQKEPPHLLKSILDCAEFRCVNHDKGCEVVVMGADKFHEHRKNCEHTVLYSCRFSNCNETRLSVKTLLGHYQRAHGGSVMKVTGDGFTLPIGFKETLDSRLNAILNVKGHHYIFACEVKDDHLFMWVWDLEHEPASIGYKTDVRYNLKLSKARNSVPGVDARKLEEFNGRCIAHTVKPSYVTIVSGGIIGAFKIKVDVFKKLFVRRSAGGMGKWWVTVSVEEKDELVEQMKRL